MSELWINYTAELNAMLSSQGLATFLAFMTIYIPCMVIVVIFANLIYWIIKRGDK